MLSRRKFEVRLKWRDFLLSPFLKTIGKEAMSLAIQFGGNILYLLFFHGVHFIHVIQAHIMPPVTSVLCFSSVYTLHLDCPCSVLPVASNSFFKDDFPSLSFSFLTCKVVGCEYTCNLSPLLILNFVHLVALWVSCSHAQPSCTFP